MCVCNKSQKYIVTARVQAGALALTAKFEKRKGVSDNYKAHNNIKYI